MKLTTLSAALAATFVFVHAAQAREQRSMQIEAAERHAFQDRFGKDQTVGHHDRRVGAMGAKDVRRFGRPQRLRARGHQLVGVRP